MNDDRVMTTYDSPRLRTLGSVHELTQASLWGNSSDGLLVLQKTVNGSTVNGS